MKVIVYTRPTKVIAKYWWIAPIAAISAALVYGVCKKSK